MFPKVRALSPPKDSVVAACAESTRADATTVALFSALPALMGLAIVFSRWQPVLVLAAHGAFWLVLVAVIHRSLPGRRAAWLFLPLLGLYLLTFQRHRYLVEQLDYILNTDTSRYVGMAAGFDVESRHVGFPVIYFPYGVVLSRAPQWARAAKEYLYLQSAVFGWLGIVLMHRAICLVTTPARRLPLLIGYVCGLSLAVWAMAGVIDTYIMSFCFLALFFVQLVEYMESDGTMARILSLSLCCAVLLAISVENTFTLPVVGLAVLVRSLRQGGTFRWDHLGIFAAVTVVMFYVPLLSAQWIVGSHIYFTHIGPRDTNVFHATRTWVNYFFSFPRLYSPRAIRDALISQGVMSILAQPHVPVHAYNSDRVTLFAIPNLLSTFVLAICVAVAGEGIRRRRELLGIAALLMTVIAFRQVPMITLTQPSSTLYTLPFLMSFWMLIGIGIGAWAPNGSGRWIQALLLCYAIALLVNNGIYLFTIR